MRSYLIRVQLPDRPGALGAVASRIGSVGGDVVSIDILERHGDLVVDELGVGLEGDHLVKLVRDEILEVDGVFVESIRPVAEPIPDRFADLLDVATDLFVQTTRRQLFEQLARHARRSLGADVAAVLRPEGGMAVAEDGDIEGRAGLPADAVRTPAGDETDRRNVVTASMPGSNLVLVVARDDPVLRARERQWISLMADLADHCCRVLPADA